MQQNVAVFSISSSPEQMLLLLPVGSDRAWGTQEAGCHRHSSPPPLDLPLSPPTLSLPRQTAVDSYSRCWPVYMIPRCILHQSTQVIISSQAARGKREEKVGGRENDG